MDTAQIAQSLEGDKLYQTRARLALPILVRQARAGAKIYYSDLAAELGMANPRNLNYVLGSVGTALEELGAAWDESVPFLQCLVVNRQDGLPGNGVSWFVKDQGEFAALSPRAKRGVVDGVLEHVYSYPYWAKVLSALGLQAVDDDFSDFVAAASKFRGGGGESEAHRDLKHFVAQHPELVGLPRSAAPGSTEFRLPSGDVVDVLFVWQGVRHAVEVKSHISSDEDITRGLFQCVKYDAVLRACIVAENSEDDATCTLIVGRSLSEPLVSLRRLLGIEVVFAGPSVASGS